MFTTNQDEADAYARGLSRSVEEQNLPGGHEGTILSAKLNVQNVASYDADGFNNFVKENSTKLGLDSESFQEKQSAAMKTIFATNDAIKLSMFSGTWYVINDGAKAMVIK